MKPGEELGNLIQYATRGIKYVLLGIPESVGPMANYGKCCTERSCLNGMVPAMATVRSRSNFDKHFHLVNR
jgi:hypothetical protein